MTENKYQMIITWSDEDQAFLVDVPDLPGCKADGKTVVEIGRASCRERVSWYV